ncbi:MAG: hypothetical protein ABSB42_04555 [Tepidisphaeraceae bacterium]|jgi:hypothetical protein
MDKKRTTANLRHSPDSPVNRQRRSSLQQNHAARHKTGVAAAPMRLFAALKCVFHRIGYDGGD